MRFRGARPSPLPWLLLLLVVLVALVAIYLLFIAPPR